MSFSSDRTHRSPFKSFLLNLICRRYLNYLLLHFFLIRQFAEDICHLAVKNNKKSLCFLLESATHQALLERDL